jgi:hypothetical protein
MVGNGKGQADIFGLWGTRTGVLGTLAVFWEL